MGGIEATQIPEGARAYLVPSLPVWGDEKAVRLGQSGLSFRAFRLIIRDPAVPEKRLCDAFVLPEELATFPLPDSLRAQVDAQLQALRHVPSTLQVPGLSAPLAFTKPLIMGVLNVTPDSFSDGGRYVDPEAAITRARQMMAEGADLIDIGGESTRPGAKPVWEGEEAERVVPVITALAAEGIPISIDTRHSFVMREALKAGAHIINDVSALTYDPDSVPVAANVDAPLVLMHSNGESKDEPIYADVLLDVYDYLQARVDFCRSLEIDTSRILLDPGIGFGKRVIEDNVELMNNLALFHTLGCPILLGASRKRFIGALTGVEEAASRVNGSVAAALKGVEQGVQIVRVHDVAATKQALLMAQGFHDHAVLNQPGLRAARRGE